ncbi:MAG: glucose-1-phosphate adenylyltransferase [Coriobacteriia bacterium]|nr:glucose-1-phosphate adenylyltransferase [Coriobacteriia bacterium]
MAQRKECIAMLLAGGQGSRLGSLTRHIAKPAVSFGGKYRIIDFGLSNCSNSGIDTVGVLTQYKPFRLNNYISMGTPWDLDVMSGGLSILPPYVGESGGTWYEGTANAIYQNIDYIQNYDPQYVLIISGDHIYHMNYGAMLDFHKSRGADLTISAVEVTLQEATQLGIITAAEDGKILKFTEKPKEPDSNLASMGVYIFSWPVLEKALLQDEADPKSEKDFGKNVIPRLLEQKKKLYTYTFKGYWKDVGTIESYYNANMELLLETPQFDIFASGSRTFSNEEILPPHYTSPNARVRNSLISNGCVIYGTVENSILAQGVYVEEGAVVKDSILLQKSRIGSATKVKRSIVGEGVNIGANCSIGIETGGTNVRKSGIALIEENAVIKDGSVIEEGSNVFVGEGGAK